MTLSQFLGFIWSIRCTVVVRVVFLSDGFNAMLSLLQALYLLLNCELNLDEALRRHKLQSVPTSGEMCYLVGHETNSLSLRGYC